MAYKDSESIQSGTSYPLGDYSFNCVFDDSPTLGQFARASMTKDGRTVYKTVSLPNNANILGYTVEANSDTADVYAKIRVPETTGASGGPLPDGVFVPVTSSAIGTYEKISDVNGNGWMYGVSGVSVGLYRPFGGTGTTGCVLSSKTPISSVAYTAHYVRNQYQGPPIEEEAQESTYVTDEYTYDGKTVYFGQIYIMAQEWGGLKIYPPAVDTSLSPSHGVGAPGIAWVMQYGTPEHEEIIEEVLVGRFKIELEDAGGVGPYSDWTDPGDWDDDWEPGEPTHTLNVEIDGALSGRHNDPLNDTSYSYIPADKATEKDYGCGGDGGNGGGGGAGASSIVVYKFATDRANSKEIVCKPKRHGYGSGGGKGGKGGDGCILVYY